MVDEGYQTVDDINLAAHLEAIEAKMSFLCRLHKSFVQVIVTLVIVVASESLFLT